MIEQKIDTAQEEKKRIVNYRIPLLVFIILFITYIISSRFIEKPPVIEEITPAIAAPGDILMISGSSFGEERSGGEVIIGGVRPSTSAYIEWSDTRISLRVPENAGSGDVLVRKRASSSNGVLFTNKNHIPVRVTDMYAAGVPQVTQIEPNNGAVGETIVLSGLNFGDLKGDGKVYFSAVSIQGASTKISKQHPEGMIPCSEVDFDYILWSDQEIQVHVPFGATSGNIIVQTDKGQSAGGYFEVSDSVGSFTFSEPRGYQIHYAVSIEEVVSGPGNEINVWIPSVFSGLEQQNIESLSDPTPLWVDERGIMRYSLENLEPWRKYILLQTFWFDRYRIDVKINPSRIVEHYDRDSKFFSKYTSSYEDILADNSTIRGIAVSQARGVKNPYYIALRLYNYIIQTYSYSEEQNKDLLEFLNKKTGNAYDYSLLFTSLARSMRIPSRMVSGILVYGNKKTKLHYWNEFFIPGFGWFPLDCTLGDGVIFEDFPDILKPADEYFGNIDNHHITFSRGINEIQRIDPGSKIKRKEFTYSLQNIHEEAVGNIESYTTTWSPVRIIDLW